MKNNKAKVYSVPVPSIRFYLYEEGELKLSLMMEDVASLMMKTKLFVMKTKSDLMHSSDWEKDSNELLGVRGRHVRVEGVIVVGADNHDGVEKHEISHSV
ncbi:uncharacterized protein HKW66_Vig0225350 [Vigna angularis]|uniref:Uncharacterized protein n=1 Tax=Phaseolus angularis TaxID=3914 RepID=A0A8T0JZ35_PHAAN|nr:uncharacterized protein HKW66_Vig0225350 [Vigna angularis]